MSDTRKPADAGANVNADVSREQAEDAIRTLLRWAGEDPSREGLLDTPKRVVKAYRDWFSPRPCALPHTSRHGGEHADLTRTLE